MGGVNQMSNESCGGRRLEGLPSKEFEHSNDLIASNGGELLNKLVDGSPVRECIQQVLTGTRVPVKQSVPPRISGLEEMGDMAGMVPGKVPFKRAIGPPLPLLPLTDRHRV
jgi:hypothetical protein